MTLLLYLFYLKIALLPSLGCPIGDFEKLVSVDYLANGPILKYEAEGDLRSFSSIDELNIASYNVFNLLELQGKFVEDPITGVVKQTKPKIKKNPKQLQGIVDTIKRANPDILVLQEVEGIIPLKILIDKYLGGDYVPLMIRGNDQRNIDIGIIVKKNLPFEYKLLSQRDLGAKSKLGKVYSRDLPGLVIYKKGEMNQKPLMTIFGTHFKSQRDRFGDPKSFRFRKRQVDEAVRIFKKFKAVFGANHPIFLAGDFNNDIRSAKEFQAFWRFGMQDTFDLAQRSLQPAQRVTHTYHPKGGVTQKNQLDGILYLGKQLDGAVIKRARIIDYRDSKGRILRLPKTYKERMTRPSDHKMVMTTIDFKAIQKQ